MREAICDVSWTQIIYVVDELLVLFCVVMSVNSLHVCVEFG